MLSASDSFFRHREPTVLNVDRTHMGPELLGNNLSRVYRRGFQYVGDGPTHLLVYLTMNPTPFFFLNPFNHCNYTHEIRTST